MEKDDREGGGGRNEDPDKERGRNEDWGMDMCECDKETKIIYRLN